MTTNWFDLPDEAESDFEPKVWSLADIYADLGTRKDIAELLNVDVARLCQWALRSDQLGSPKPVARFGPIFVYSKQEWVDWHARFMDGKRPGTKWTDNARDFVETRRQRLDPTYVHGNAGANNARKGNWKHRTPPPPVKAHDDDTD